MSDFLRDRFFLEEGFGVGKDSLFILEVNLGIEVILLWDANI